MADNQNTNNASIISLTTGILSFLLPLIGLILAIIGVIFSKIAVRQIQSTNEAGRGLATAGLICSIIGIVLQLLVVVGFVSFYSYRVAGTLSLGSCII